MELLECVFKREGCQEHVLRKDFEKHVVDPSHTVYLIQRMSDLTTKVEGLEKENSDLKGQLKAASETIQQLSSNILGLNDKTGFTPPPPPPPTTLDHHDHSPTLSRHDIPGDGTEGTALLHDFREGDCVTLEDPGFLYPTVGRIPDHSGLESWPTEEIKRLSINTNWKRRHRKGDVGVVVHVTRHTVGGEVVIVKIENDYVVIGKQGVRPLATEAQ